METVQMNSRKEIFVNTYNYSMKDDYDIITQLGKGGYGKVFEVRHKKTKAVLACKYIAKSKIKEKDLQRIRREINILKKVDHPNIVKIYEVYETNRSLYIIMEKCNGGELFDKIIDNISQKRMFSEKETAKIFLQIMSAINYCHKNGICHRDLKPENILLLQKDNEEDYPIKLIDFGLSQIFKENKKLNSKVGTAYYISPEVLCGRYTEKCDVWSAGVILCILLTGQPPFNGPNSGVIYGKIQNYDYSFSNKWKLVSNEAKDLISHMLVPERNRYNTKQVLAHPWLQKYKEDMKINPCLDINIMKSYGKMNYFKKNILTFIASRLDENNNDINRINQYFKLFDKDYDGQISLEEFQDVLVNMNMEKNEITDIFNSLDINKNGFINYTEFVAAFLEKDIYLSTEAINEAFTFFDKNHKGTISKEVIIDIFEMKNKKNENIERFFNEKNINKEGHIDRVTFEKIMNEL